MNFYKSIQSLCWASLFLMMGCSQNSDPTRKDKTGPSAQVEGKKYLLEAEPAGAKGVLETRKQVKNGEEVVMVGRIAGSKKPFVEGRASFSVTDLSIPPCEESENCPTPWDCCCVPPEELLPAMAQVRIVGSDGKTLPRDAKEMLGIKELTVVVVQGKASRDEQGNLTVIADGLFPRPGKN